MWEESLLQLFDLNTLSAVDIFTGICRGDCGGSSLCCSLGWRILEGFDGCEQQLSRLFSTQLQFPKCPRSRWPVSLLGVSGDAPGEEEEEEGEELCMLGFLVAPSELVCSLEEDGLHWGCSSGKGPSEGLASPGGACSVDSEVAEHPSSGFPLG